MELVNMEPRMNSGTSILDLKLKHLGQTTSNNVTVYNITESCSGVQMEQVGTV